MFSPLFSPRNLQVWVYSQDLFSVEVDLSRPYFDKPQTIKLSLNTEKVIGIVWSWSHVYKLNFASQPTLPHVKFEKTATDNWVMLLSGGKEEIVGLLNLLQQREWKARFKPVSRVFNGNGTVPMYHEELLAHLEKFLLPMDQHPPFEPDNLGSHFASATIQEQNLIGSIGDLIQITPAVQEHTMDVDWDLGMEDQFVTQTIVLSKPDVSAIIGRKGERIKEMRAAAGCRITVLPISHDTYSLQNNVRRKEFPQTIALFGTPDQVLRAISLIRSALTNYRSQKRR